MVITESLQQIGARCTISAHPYEVSFVSENGIRFSPEHGGSQRYLNYATLNELIEQEAIEVTYIPNPENNQTLSGLTEKQISTLNRKLSYVKGVYRSHTNPCSQRAIKNTVLTIAKEIGDLKPPSTSSVAGWIKKWISGGYHMLSLAPKMKPSRSYLLKEDPVILRIMEKAVRDVYLNEQRNPQTAVLAEITIKVAQYNASHEIPIEPPSKNKVTRYIKSLDAYEIARKRYGKAYANRKFRAAGRAFYATEPLDLVMADGQIMDIILVKKHEDGTIEEIGRPFLTAFIDVRTRVILGFYISIAPFCAATLLRALADCVVPDRENPKGIPQKLIIDNGSDYLDSGFLRACCRLNIAIEACKPRDPNAKAIIERFFRTLNTDLIHKLPGTTFSNPEDRGDYISQEMAKLTIGELRSYVSNWIEDIYHLSDHRTLQRAPIDVWNDEAPQCFPNTLDKQDAEILLRDERECTLSNGRIEAHGLQWKCTGLKGWEYSQRRLGHDPKVTALIDELDLFTVYVTTRDNPGRPQKAVSICPLYTQGLSLYEHKLVKAELKKKRIKARISRMKDKELYRLRLEFHAALGHRDDRIAKRTLQRLLDHKAALRLKDTSDEPSAQEVRENSASQGHETEPNNNYQDETSVATPLQHELREKHESQYPSTKISKRKPL